MDTPDVLLLTPEQVAFLQEHEAETGVVVDWDNDLDALEAKYRWDNDLDALEAKYRK